MNESFIAVLDSGIGGMTVLNELIKIMPNEKYLYLGDNKNAPYGNKSLEEMWELTKFNLDLLSSYKLKCLVIGCNTLSVNLMDEIKNYVKVPTFGVFPPVGECKPDERTLLLSTVKTAKAFKHEKNFHVLGLKNLVVDIEKNLLDINIIDISVNLLKSDGFFVDEKGYYDTVILGCTHYCFIKNKIFNHFCPKKIISGNTFTAKKVKEYLNANKLLVKHKRFDVEFIGESADINQFFYVKSGQKY